MKFKSEIKKVLSSKAKLVFVKMPDATKDLTVDNTLNNLRGKLYNENWGSKKMPYKRLVFIDYSHKITESEMKNIFSSWEEFYEICNKYKIFYNFSNYTGKWAVLKKINNHVPNTVITTK